MSTLYESGYVRARVTGENPEVTDNVVVEEKLADGSWQVRRRFNSLSDDYAYTNARDAARDLSHRLREKLVAAQTENRQ